MDSSESVFKKLRIPVLCQNVGREEESLGKGNYEWRTSEEYYQYRLLSGEGSFVLQNHEPGRNEILLWGMVGLGADYE